jgi:predicted amidophosphoribosyltransferase
VPPAAEAPTACPHCEAPIAVAGARFCSQCGAPLRAPAAAEGVAPV